MSGYRSNRNSKLEVREDSTLGGGFADRRFATAPKEKPGKRKLPARLPDIGRRGPHSPEGTVLPAPGRSGDNNAGDRFGEGHHC